MLDVLKIFLEKLNLIEIIEYYRKSNNRRRAAKLLLVVTQLYTVLKLARELFEILEEELGRYQRTASLEASDYHLYRIRRLLTKQAYQVAVLDELVDEMLDEIMLVDERIAQTYQKLFYGKTTFLFHLQTFLRDRRLLISQYDLDDSNPPDELLWFPVPSLPGERDLSMHELCNFPGNRTVEVSVDDLKPFMALLEKYFSRANPLTSLKEIENAAESYKQALLQHFSLEDLLSDFGRVKRATHAISLSDKNRRR